jgi:protein SCO1/2
MSRIAFAAAAIVVAGGLGVGGWMLTRPGDGLSGCREGGGVVGADIGGPFTLTRSDGARVTDAQVFDRLSLLYFGYTHCPDFCPTDAATMAQATDLLAERGIAVRPVFVTIDPARDTEAVVGEFAANFHPDMVGLTGSDADIAAAARAWRVYYAKQGDDPAYYLMDHSTFTYLVHPERGFIDFFRHGETPGAIAERIACYAERL